jgi:4-diphosphocytidyl-2-C-methyl-D-erythritol kinase
MTETWDAPAKVNLSLEVRSPDSSGMHPLRSLVQTIEWCDRLTMEEAEDDHLDIRGADLPEGGDNLVWKAVAALRQKAERDRPGIKVMKLHITLEKSIAVAAGLGGGSADAAAALLALAALTRLDPQILDELAPTVGADVPVLLTGGSVWMEGHGDRLTLASLVPAFSVGVAVPDLFLTSAEVYRRWDQLEYPTGPALEGRALPPALRELAPLRNDLFPAAVAIRPELADWASELARAWERPVAMTGSGPALFAYFADLDEAEQAVRSISPRARSCRAAMPRATGADRSDAASRS